MSQTALTFVWPSTGDDPAARPVARYALRAQTAGSAIQLQGCFSRRASENHFVAVPTA